MKKTWIKIKRGFLQPAHRSKMGIRVWLYMFIIDQADWDTGIVYDWTDKNAADELGMPIGTLRQQRQELETLRYINCYQEGNHQKITILKWVDPRSYSGEIMNNSEGTNEGEVEGTDKGTETSVPLHSTHKSLIINQSVPKKQEPIYGEFNNQSDMPQEWVDEYNPVKTRKPNISENEQRLAKLIADTLGIKPPICNTKKEYAAAQVTWWKPIKEMLRQVDQNIQEAESIADCAIEDYRKARLTMTSPKSVLSGFIAVLVREKNGH